jgi:CRP-like cAMP-binding protein
MLHLLSAYVKEKILISDSDMELIEASVTLKRLRKGQYLLQEGDICRFVAFVAEGCLRTYTVDLKGQEHIIYFAAENWWAGDRESYTAGIPSSFYIDAVEQSEVILFQKGNFEMLCAKIPAFGELINAILQKGFITSQNRIHVALSFTAEQKYIDFLKRHPKLANRLPQQMIASYLGITPATLSRIRGVIQKR